ncbi:hypothetical protein LTR85_001273 [Meristemomyces frigidus]|nr:hypothetical protein LTR85_001273 [Meristemomyces frigidus]
MQPAAARQPGRPKLPEDLRQARKAQSVLRSRHRQALKRADNGVQRRAPIPPQPPGFTTCFVLHYTLDQHPAHWHQPKPPYKKLDSSGPRYKPKPYAAEYLVALKQCAKEHGYAPDGESEDMQWYTYLWNRAGRMLDLVEPAVENIHATFPTEGQARDQISSRALNTLPMITSGSGHHIYNTAVEFVTAFGSLSRKASIQDSSKPRSGHMNVEPDIRSVLGRLRQDVPSARPYNWLDATSLEPIGSGVPCFLQHEDTNLLSLLEKDTSTGDGGVDSARAQPTSILTDVQRWALVSEAGFPTPPHMDGNGFETWITVMEGDIGFVWWHQPEKDALDRWAGNTHFPQEGNWCFLVLGPGDTVFFPSGTVHAVLRQCRDQHFGTWGQNGRTFAYGGHLLRYSRIATFSSVMRWQMEHPGVTNEEVAITSTRLFYTIGRHVQGITDDAEAARWGGLTAIETFKANAVASTTFELSPDVPLDKDSVQCIKRFIHWHINHSDIHTLDTAYVRFRQWRIAYKVKHRNVLGPTLASEMKNYTRAEISLEFELTQQRSDKRVMNIDDLLVLLHHHWAVCTAWFPTERQRVQLALLLLVIAYTGVRPCGVLEVPRTRTLEEAEDGDDPDFLTSVRDPDARVDSLKYKDINMFKVKDPMSEREHVFLMIITSRLMKNNRHKGLPLVVLPQAGACRLRLLLTRARWLAEPADLFTFEVADARGMQAIPLEWKPEMLEVPLLRRTEKSVQGETTSSNVWTYDNARYAVLRLGKAVGMKEPFNLYDGRRGAGEAIDTCYRRCTQPRDGTRSDRDLREFYTNQIVATDTISAFLGTPSADWTIRVASHLSLTRDPYAERSIAQPSSQEVDAHLAVEPLLDHVAQQKLRLIKSYGPSATLKAQRTHANMPGFGPNCTSKE